MQTNQQPIEKPDFREDGSVTVIGIWDTIQGEGPYAGTPAVFIRLAGCNLQCPMCDTDYTEGKGGPLRMYPPAIVRDVHEAAAGRPRKLVVLTGGEPFRQNVAPLIADLLTDGRRVQIETNGTLCPKGVPFERVTVVCSPKAGVNRNLAPHVTAWKYVLREGDIDPADGLPTSALGLDCRPGRPPGGFRRGEVFVQPLDEQDEGRNRLNLEACIESCMKHGYRLTVQMHKAAGLP
jgi:7-carboxy-7-deazaguanine synthase